MNQDLLKKLDEAKKKLDNLRPFSDAKNSLIQEKLRLEWTYNSNAIEGNSLTLKETAFFLREGLTVEGKPLKDFLEAKNHIEAIGFVENIIKEKREITESFMKELNVLLLKNIDRIKRQNEQGQIFEHRIFPGEYKKQPSYVLTFSGNIHRYPDPLEVPEKMEDLVRLYNESKLHPAELASEFHYKFVAIHPFDDCNGREARLLMNLILIKNGYLPAIILIEERRKYIEALEKGDSGDLNDFKNFIAEKAILTINSVLDIIKDDAE